MKQAFLALLLCLHAAVSIAKPQYCFQILANGSRAKPVVFDVLKNLKKHGIDPADLIFTAQNRDFKDGFDIFTSRTVTVYLRSQSFQSPDGSLAEITLRKYQKKEIQFIYSFSVRSHLKGVGMGALLYLLGARIALEYDGLPLGTITKEEWRNDILLSYHSTAARSSWERMASSGWAENFQREVDSTAYEFFVFYPEHIRSLSESVWQLYLAQK